MYDCDPVKNPDAKLHRRLSFRQVGCSASQPLVLLGARSQRSELIYLSQRPCCAAQLDSRRMLLPRLPSGAGGWAARDG